MIIAKNLLHALNVELNADPAGGMSRADFLTQGAAEIVKETEAANKAADEIDDSEDEEETEDLEETEEDSEEEIEDEEVVSKVEYDKKELDLSNSRKEVRHLKQLLRAHKIDPKSSAKDAQAIEAGKDSFDGPSEREVSRFNRSVRSELKAAGFDERIAKLLVNQFDINEDEDDDYVSDRVEELKEDYKDFIKTSTPVKNVRKARSDLGLTHATPKEPKLNSVQMRMKAAGMPYK